MKDMLKEDFANEAEWRREKAIEHPDDERNVDAAQLLDELARTVDDVDDDLLEAFENMFAESDSYRAVELLGQALRDVGFSSAPSNASEFVRDFIEEAARWQPDDSLLSMA
jgi:predicted P-loop ATPase/GTPase